MFIIDLNITQALIIERANEILNSVGIMPNLAGFTYLRTAMVLAVEQKTPFFQITKLYQAIAKQYGVRATSVEHAIRYAIESAYGADPERIQRVFRYHVAKPSNSEMIALAVDILRIQLMREDIIKY